MMRNRTTQYFNLSSVESSNRTLRSLTWPVGFGGVFNDLKWDNVIFCVDGKVVFIIDCGFAKFSDQLESRMKKKDKNI